ncbi:MAG: hydratase [Pseudomonadota bacterium]
MSFATIDHAAGLLADLRLKLGGFAVIDELPPQCRPETLFDAYEVQSRVRELLSRRHPGRQIGRTIDCISSVMQGYLKVPHPCAGTLYENTTYRDHAVLQADRYARFGLNCEIGVELSSDLTERRDLYTAETVAPAVGSVMTVIGIVEHRFRDFRQTRLTSLVADDFLSAGCVLGAPVKAQDVADLQTLIGSLTLDGRVTAASSYGAAAPMPVLSALAWLAQHCIGLGEPLQAGQIVTLGSIVKPVYPKPGQRIEAAFDGLPPASIEVT